MNRDPVVEEVRARGRQLTARHGNDARAVLELLQEEARRHPQGLVDSVAVVSTATEPDLSAVR